MVNYAAILVSGILAMVIGALWYGPVFGKLWMKLADISQRQIEDGKKKGMAKNYVITFLGTLVMSYVLALFIGYSGLTSFLGGMQIGFMAWIGFLATTMIGMILWEGKSLKLYLLNVLHYFVVLLLIGGILAVWT